MFASLCKYSASRLDVIDISEKEKDPTSIPLPVGVSLPLGKGREALKPPNASREEGGRGVRSAYNYVVSKSFLEMSIRKDL